MKDYLFIVRNCDTSASFADTCFSSRSVNVVGYSIRNDGIRANYSSEIFNSRTTRNDRVSERITQSFRQRLPCFISLCCH